MLAKCHLRWKDLQLKQKHLVVRIIYVIRQQPFKPPTYLFSCNLHMKRLSLIKYRLRLETLEKIPIVDEPVEFKK